LTTHPKIFAAVPLGTADEEGFSNNNRKGGLMPINAEPQSNPPRIIRLPEVMKRTGLPRASVYQQMALGTFPRQVSISLRSRGWVESEVDGWIEQRIAARGAVAGQ
jgi:prophage regulatory protein